MVIAAESIDSGLQCSPEFFLRGGYG